MGRDGDAEFLGPVMKEGKGFSTWFGRLSFNREFSLVTATERNAYLYDNKLYFAGGKEVWDLVKDVSSISQGQDKSKCTLVVKGESRWLIFYPNMGEPEFIEKRKYAFGRINYCLLAARSSQSRAKPKGGKADAIELVTFNS